MNQSQVTLKRIAGLDYDIRSNMIIDSVVKDTVSQILESVEDDDIKLQVGKVWVDHKYDNSDIGAQKEVRNKGQVWADELRADLSIVDKKTGKTIDSVGGIKVANIPKVTDRGTFIIKGNEYQFAKQSRLKPGVYTKVQSNGEISSFFNVDKTIDFDRGFNNNFKINFEPERKVFTMGYGTKNVPLINALRALGVSDSEMRNKWGEDVYSANAGAYDRHDVVNTNKLYEAVFGRRPQSTDTQESVQKQIRDRLFKTELDPNVTKITLGTAYKNVNKGALLDASKKIIDIHKGDVDGDDRESLVFKSFYDVEDHIRERLVKNSGKIINNMKFKLNKNRSINRSISSQMFDPFVVGSITSNQLSTPPNQTNPMSIIGETTKVMVVGEGGIGTPSAITNEARQISNSEAGFMDPLHTPEGGAIGVTTHLTVGTVKVGNDIYGKFVDKKGEEHMLSPMDAHDKNVAFPDEYKTVNGKLVPKSKKIRVIGSGKLKEVDASDVDYIIPAPERMFDTSVNLIPFLDSIQGNRGLTASKMQEQALSLVNRDSPLVEVVSDSGKPISQVLGGLFATPKSPVEGEVISVHPDKIIIETDKGDEQVVNLYHNFSLNSESYLNNDPVVKVGDKVKKGQLLADNNFTRDGKLAIGANLRVAYMPYKGYNYEDSAIISESAAKKLTSQHMYDFKTRRSSDGVFSKEKFRAYYPEELKSDNADKLDSDGVVRVGQKVNRDEVLIAHMERKAPSADDIAVGRLDKQLKRDMASHALKWDKDEVGVVTDVQKHGNNVVVSVKTEERLKVADKISGLHGNKHIVSKIVPDEEMPFDPKTGKHIEITMSPIGVSNRINTSQLIENAAGKIAEATGKPYQIKNFTDHDNSRAVLEDLKKLGLSDKDELVDPSTGKPFLNPVANGVSHILKLEHIVDHKFSARYKDGYDSNEQPISGGHTGGKNLGRMETAALLARGAKENLKEMFAVKGQRNDDFWRAMETGQSLPPPKKAFVWDKMLATMAGAGINVEQNGKTFQLKPMTDKDVIAISSGEVKDPTLTYRRKDLAPMRNGLFDPDKVGGVFGNRYTHIKLPEKILNPIMATATANLLDIPKTELDRIIVGKTFVDKNSGELVSPGTPNSLSGGPAVESLLSKINVDRMLSESEEKISTTKNPSEMNKLHKRIRYLKSMKDNKLKPTDYMVENIPVIPSKYRPMFSMGTEKTVIMSDINDLYQQVGFTKNAIDGLNKELGKVVKDDDTKNLMLAEARGALYNDVKAVVGLGDPTSFLHRARDKKGLISLIDGGKEKQTKEGFFQSKVMQRRQDLVGRSTIILNPNIGGDQMGIPKEMADKIFQPFIMKKLTSWGYKPLEAAEIVKNKDSVYERARQVIADERLIIANRAPTLHRWNMTAFKPVLTDGKSIEVPAVAVSKNFGGDFDGDCVLSTMYISLDIKKLHSFIKMSGGCVFFGDLCIDSDCGLNYIADALKKQEVSVPHISELVCIDNELVMHCHISQFPRVSGTGVTRGNGNVDYDVPDGVSIFTIDNNTHEFVKVAVTKFSVHKDLVNYTVFLSKGDSLLVSGDQSVVRLNTNTWEIEKCTPEDLVTGSLIPKVIGIDVVPTVFEIPLEKFSDRAVQCVDKMPLNYDSGWLLGSMVGDGWCHVSDSHNQVCISSNSHGIANKFKQVVVSLMCEGTSVDMCRTENPHVFDGFSCFGVKYTFCSVNLSRNIKPLIGSSAANKHLPKFFLSSPVEFRLGLLSGLLDTDGAVCWIKKKRGRQFNVQYSTISEVLADEIVTLCRSLGISASITIGNKTQNGQERRVVISSNTIHGKGLLLHNENKAAALAEFYSIPLADSSVSARNDLVPFSAELFSISKEFVRFDKDKRLYSNINSAKTYRWRISRQSALRLIDKDVDGRLPERWKQIVRNRSITWLYAKKVILNKGRVDMYDITAPGPYTFMLQNGVIVQDTFQIHVPVSAKAQKEASQMLPSSSMLKVGFDSVLNMPDMDSVVGAYLASKGDGGKDTGLKFKDIEEAMVAFKENKIMYSDKVTIGGKKDTLCMHDANSVVPEQYQRWGTALNKGNIESWIRDVTKGVGGSAALGLADKLKDIGNNYSTQYGFTLGISDTVADKDMQKKVIELVGNVKKGDVADFVNKWGNALESGKKMLKDKHSDKTMIGVAIASGGGKGIGNTSAITLMPGVVSDASGAPVQSPITKSYSEGLDTAGYWYAAHGARGGNIQKSVQSFKPGWLTKDLINSIYETRIESEDPVDNEGVEYSISDDRAVMNRYLATDVVGSKGKVIAKRNEVVNSDLVNRMNREGVKKIRVQSPLTDPTPGDGFSSYSYGIDYDGKRKNIGDNIGVMAAHTITEPSLNMAMRAFHTGGAMQTGKRVSNTTVFDQLFDTLQFTKKSSDKGTMASFAGTVDDIKKSSIGGWDVTISDGTNKEVRYVNPNNDVKVKKGDKVSVGDMLSTGDPSPHDIVKYKGMREAQHFLVGKLDEFNDGKLDKREIETVIRGITNTTRIKHQGSSKDYVPGDVAPLTTVEYYNKNNEKDEDIENAEGDHLAADYGQLRKNTKITREVIERLAKQGTKRIHVFKDRIKHEPFLTPGGIAAKASASEDWISRLAHNRVRSALEEGTAMGWKTEISENSGNPLPELITGEFKF